MNERRAFRPPSPPPPFPRCEKCNHTWHGVECVAPRFIRKLTRCEPCACPSSLEAVAS